MTAVTHDGWWFLGAGAEGAAHRAAGQPTQDVLGHNLIPPAGPYVFAVADGHGHARHFRSAVGANLAVRAACIEGLELVTGLLRTAGGNLARAVAERLPTHVLRAWRAAVAKDVAANPYTPEQAAALDEAGDSPEIPYGSTLLFAVGAGPLLVCAQIGDGDMLAVRPDGSTFAPLPDEGFIDGIHTASLCQPDALDAFRVAVWDLTVDPMLLVLIATDGYGNSQTAEPWQPGVGADLARFVHEYGHEWLRDQLGGWAERCATEGSGDDTTIVLLFPPDGR